MLVLVFLLLCLALLAGFLSAGETALTAASRVRLHHFQKSGRRAAETVLRLQKNMNQVIATLLLANTVVITTLTAISTALFTKLFGEAGVFYAAATLSALITIYLEVLPKAFVFPRAETVAMALAPFIEKLQNLLFPLTRLVDLVARVSLRLVGVKGRTESAASTLDDLKGAIDLHHKTGADHREGTMLKNILDLTSVTVSEVMLHKGHVFSLDASKPTAHLIERILVSPFTRIPFWTGNKDTIQGVLHVKELYRALQKTDPDDLDLSKILTPPWFIPESTTLIQQLQAFRERREHFAFVVDEYGSFTGIVTLEDVLEEIVGDIKDEHDLPASGITPKGPNCFLIDGTVTLRDLEKEHAWDMPETDATTLAGLVLEEAGYIPKEGQTVQLSGFDVKVLKRHRNQLKLLRVQFPNRPAKDPTETNPG